MNQMFLDIIVKLAILVDLNQYIQNLMKLDSILELIYCLKNSIYSRSTLTFFYAITNSYQVIKKWYKQAVWKDKRKLQWVCVPATGTQFVSYKSQRLNTSKVCFLFTAQAIEFWAAGSARHSAG